ncbi:hypothetical protein [Actinomadura macra]|uniref:hypothetical protein n=1 Tax=Actinomadura macra TaxID=46164 RepID=UPI00082FD2F1|nr:hypothetical protein [Actinomadura macra]
MDDTKTTVDAAVHAASTALRAAGLSPTDDEIGRIAAGYHVLRAKADALSELALRDDPPVDPVALPPAGALPGGGARPCSRPGSRQGSRQGSRP